MGVQTLSRRDVNFVLFLSLGLILSECWDDLRYTKQGMFTQTSAGGARNSKTLERNTSSSSKFDADS